MAALGKAPDAQDQGVGQEFTVDGGGLFVQYHLIESGAGAADENPPLFRCTAQLVEAADAR